MKTVVIVTVIVSVLFGITWYTTSAKHVNPKISETPNATHTPTPTPLIPTETSIPTLKPTSTPLVDCVGPDGKSIKLSQKACTDFKKAWGISPTVAQPTSAPATCTTATDLGNLTVRIQAESGQTLVGDAGVVMSDGSGNCAGHDNRLPYAQIIYQGSTSVVFSGYRPAKFHVKVNYHGHNYDNDVNINPGENSITVTVSN